MNNTPCQFCPFAEASIYLSFPPQIKCTITGWYHNCDNTACNVIRTNVIPIKWIKKYASKKSYDDGMDCYWTFWEEDVLKMIEDWEKENETNRCR